MEHLGSNVSIGSGSEKSHKFSSDNVVNVTGCNPMAAPF